MTISARAKQRESQRSNVGEPQHAPALWFGRIAPTVLLLVALLMRLYQLNVPFDRDGYDEGVYWQSLRAMHNGQGLYHAVFYSQPPAFLLSVYPIFVFFGSSLWSARLAIALISLLGFVGAYLLGKSLAGRAGMLVALLLLLFNPLYLAESHILQAEGPSVALTLLAIGLAFLWWREPTGRRGLCWAALCGISLALSIFCKLLCVTTLVPIALLMGARIWQIRRGKPGQRVKNWLPIIAGVGATLVTGAALLLPFSGSFAALWSSVVTFHQVAAHIFPGTLGENVRNTAPVLLSLLGAAAGYGTLTALLRKDWRVLPLLAWLLATIILLLLQRPLFPHHLVALIPPLLALAILSVADLASYKKILTSTRLARIAPVLTTLAALLILLTASFDLWQDAVAYQAIQATSTSANIQVDLRAASDLRHAITPDQWVITDGQFIAGLADRNTPPGLVDTSTVRIVSGYVTLAQLEQAASDPRVHAVLFYTTRFSLPNTAAFHTWVAQRFHLIHTYGPGQELWVS